MRHLSRMYEQVEPIAQSLNLYKRLETCLSGFYKNLKGYNLQNMVDSHYRMGLRIAKEEGNISTYENLLLSYVDEIEEKYSTTNS